MTEQKLELKGTNFTLSVIHLFDADIDIIKQSLLEKVAQAPSFFKYAPIVINISHIQDFNDWINLKNVIHDCGLHLVGISGCTSAELKMTINQAGIAVLTEGKKIEPQKDKTSIDSAAAAMPSTHINEADLTKSKPVENIEKTKESRVKTKVVTTPIRSGQQIYARNSDLVVLNNVGAGAEVIADGNIHIYGIMRGKALAGASGDEDAKIFCQNLEAELLSIAGNYWLNEQIPKDQLGKAALVTLTERGLILDKL
ncbi:septum site-determining protein MinC [Thorsellia anophelis]|uniref:Probable septum site-determining protein MinC n=1 Tax=Thorsellia anophelis DSM 18579 TaxID=1123402 RepID=A0A1I0EIY2_9GAMM|nr:septum site-determining protein MinC [Thorsellia anophelis]SET45109.1 septum site-determining protein MinC [Thorsellia anophelis DSM 18579]